MKLEYIHSEYGTSYVEMKAFGSGMPICLARRLENGKYCAIINSDDMSLMRKKTFDNKHDMLKFVRDNIEIL